jgi:hypothetical protein
MAALTGSALFLKFGSAVLDTDYRSFSATEDGGVVDASAGADANRTYLTTLKDGTASTTIVVQAGDTTTWDAVAPLTSGSLIWAEQGSAAGTRNYRCDAIVLSREKSMEYADLVVGDIEFQFNGTITAGTF